MERPSCNYENKIITNFFWGKNFLHHNVS